MMWMTVSDYGFQQILIPSSQFLFYRDVSRLQPNLQRVWKQIWTGYTVTCQKSCMRHPLLIGHLTEEYFIVCAGITLWSLKGKDLRPWVGTSSMTLMTPTGTLLTKFYRFILSMLRKLNKHRVQLLASSKSFRGYHPGMLFATSSQKWLTEEE